MDEVRQLLAEPLEVDNGHELMKQLVQIESWGARISLLFREAEKELTRQRGMLFNPALSSEDKRRSDLEYKTREPQQKADELSDLADLVKRRISLGQTLLSRAWKQK